MHCKRIATIATIVNTLQLTATKIISIILESRLAMVIKLPKIKKKKCKKNLLRALETLPEKENVRLASFPYVFSYPSKILPFSLCNTCKDLLSTNVCVLRSHCIIKKRRQNSITLTWHLDECNNKCCEVHWFNVKLHCIDKFLVSNFLDSI